jgi:MFS family permease
MLGHMFGLLLLTYATSRWMIWMFIPLHGLAWGVRGPLMQALRADYFGSTSFGKIMGVSSLVVMLGMICGPLLAGTLADVTGSYQLGFTILALMAGAGLTFFVVASPPQPPDRTRSGPLPVVDGTSPDGTSVGGPVNGAVLSDAEERPAEPHRSSNHGSPAPPARPRSGRRYRPGVRG